MRIDSGFDSRDNIAVCDASGVAYVIKRNLCRESEEVWLQWAKEPGKRRWVAALGRGERRPARMVVEAIERSVLANGHRLLILKVEVATWWTSLPDDPETVIRLYHEHGTMEQFHSEFKTDQPAPFSTRTYPKPRQFTAI